MTAMKPAKYLIQHEDALETPPDLLDTFITPTEHFFVCSATQTPLIDIKTYVIEISGDAVERPVTLTFDDLVRMPARTFAAYLECAGNHRALFSRIHGKEPQTNGDLVMTPWMIGGIGNAIWTGVSLSDVLALAGVKETAVDVNIKGLDRDAPEGGVSRPIPIEKALDPDTILAYMMNGEMLPPDHGAPVRLVVPGWIGANSIKWVGSITVSSEKIWVERNTKHYVMIGDEWAGDHEHGVLGGEITTQTIKSSLLLPWNVVFRRETKLIRGIARSPHAPIQRVEWCIYDINGEWVRGGHAQLLPPFFKHAWVHFEFEWDDAIPGEYTITTRAVDRAGNAEPMEIPFNQEGYLFNQVYGHPVKVKLVLDKTDMWVSNGS